MGPEPALTLLGAAPLHMAVVAVGTAAEEFGVDDENAAPYAHYDSDASVMENVKPAVHNGDNNSNQDMIGAISPSDANYDDDFWSMLQSEVLGDTVEPKKKKIKKE